MVYIKKLVLKGFKSFVKETKIPFSNSMNVIVGPNGSGKSNIVDALCFVLGRLSIKSMRAAKSANLIFAGTKLQKPSSEASIKLIFDNSDKAFSIETKEIILERIVRKTGQSIYKINNETKTRYEVLELLAQAGIDPHGFNIILQGEISGFVKMHSEERRKIIEEIAGISIYEIRKAKSLRELEKTEEKIKEVRITLGSRISYLQNLEKERRQALRYKKLEVLVKRYKASIIKRELSEKRKALNEIESKKKEKDSEITNIRKREKEIMKQAENLEKEISKINSQIQKASGIEQGQLNKDISDLRAELSGLNVRKEGNEERLSELLSKREKLEAEIQSLSQEKEFKNLEKARKELQASLKTLEKINTERESQEKEISVFSAEISNLQDIKKQVDKLDICPLCKSKITKSHIKQVFAECDEKISNMNGKIIENKQLIIKTKKEIESLQTKITELQDNIPKLKIKEGEQENLKQVQKENKVEAEQLESELAEFESEIEEKEKLLEEEDGKARLLEKKFSSLMEKRADIEKQVHQSNSSLLEERNKITQVGEEINKLSVEIAELNAIKKSLETDLEPYKGMKIIVLPLHALKERLTKTQSAVDSMGPVNLKALQVYDEIKKDYEAINEKISVLDKEKQEILKIIEEIDKKKKRTFIKTLKAMNELFNRNFTQLSTKGSAFLELENSEDPFSGGLDITIKVGKGKYFDVSSLSGGEQTLVALSLIFAIQEYKPYFFYILDEVDAALDKRNSERLAVLIKKYMKTGQYIIITHNDAIITESTLLYGVSMQENISKILSLEV